MKKKKIEVNELIGEKSKLYKLYIYIYLKNIDKVVKRNSPSESCLFRFLSWYFYNNCDDEKG